MYDDISYITDEQKTKIIQTYLEKCAQLNEWIDVTYSYCEYISKNNILVHVKGINHDHRRGSDAIREYIYTIPIHIFFSSKNLKEWLKEEKIREAKEREEYHEYQRLKKKFERE